MAVSCRNIAENVANGRLAREELDTLMERLEAERAALEGLDNVESRLMDAGRIILEDLQLAKAIEKRNRLKNVLKYQELTSAIDLADAEAGDPSLGLRAPRGRSKHAFPWGQPISRCKGERPLSGVFRADHRADARGGAGAILLPYAPRICSAKYRGRFMT
jgi:hypothetical protein